MNYKTLLEKTKEFAPAINTTISPKNLLMFMNQIEIEGYQENKHYKEAWFELKEFIKKQKQNIGKNDLIRFTNEKLKPGNI